MRTLTEEPHVGTRVEIRNAKGQLEAEIFARKREIRVYL
jgi:hypothetical protein